MDAVETELQHMIATDTGDTDRAASIRSAWDAHTDRLTTRARRMNLLIVTASATLWTGAIVIITHLLTQLIP